VITLLDFIDGGTVGGVTLPPLRLPGRDPIRLSERQRSILAEAMALGEDGLPAYRTVALCWPKGGGKSLLAAAELARVFVTVPDSRSIILGPSERQVTSVVTHTFRDLLRATYPGFDVGKTVIENPALGSSVVIVPASEGSVQGVRPHKGVVVIDEAHEFPADPEARADSEVGGALNLLLSQAEDAIPIR
jgi:superfamily II DNA or RNA helicase